jgi:hypothetical protein
MRRFFTGEQQARSASSEELAQFTFVFGLPFPTYESCAQFGDYDNGHNDRFCFFQQRDCLCDSFPEIAVPVGVNCNSHRHWSGSTLSWSASAAGKLAPRWNTQLAAVHERELKRESRNRATLAVARKLVAYLVSVDRSGRPFQLTAAT